MEEKISTYKYSGIIMHIMVSWYCIVLQVIRLESQVKRYKNAAETSEKNEEELKAEKRKLQREVNYLFHLNCFYFFIAFDCFVNLGFLNIVFLLLKFIST